MIYKEIAKTIDARNRCHDKGNWEWYDKHSDRLEMIEKNYLPSGSGFDNGTSIDWENSTDNEIVLVSAYHKMDENGFYDGWVDLIINVTPSLAFDIDIEIDGDFGDDVYQLEDYIYDVFYIALTQEMKGE